jgi:hypothetical protein
MKNTVLKFDYEDLEEFVVSDYFSAPNDISYLVHEIKDYLEVYKINDNDKLERISYELYGTTDYWDILLLLNGRDPLFDFPYDYDAIYDSARKFANKYMYYIYSGAPLIVGPVAAALYEEFLQKYIDTNESNRFMFIVKPNKIGEFIKVLKDNGHL